MPVKPPPSRDELLQRLDRENAGAGMGLMLRWTAIAVATVFVDWADILANPAPAGVFLLVLLGRYGLDLLPLLGRKRKRLRDLRPDTTLGEHNRESLLALVRTVEQRLGIPADKYPVYVVRDKTLNAAAVSLGLDALFGRVDGVYLNRQTLHVLRADELAFVIGHEFGHSHRYYLKATRWEALNLIAVAMAGLALLPIVWRWEWVGVFGLGLLAAGGLAAMRSRSLASMRVIEHLCDDYGAQAAGVVAGVNALLKMASESEAANRILRFCLEVGKRRKGVDPIELMEEYQRGMPFGVMDKAEAEQMLANSVRTVEQRNNTISFRGFLDYLNDDEEIDEDAVGDLQAEWAKLDEAPIVDWSKPLRETGEQQLTGEQIDRVIAALQANPAALLARAPEELATQSTHPATRKRVRYLWENRSAIQAAG